MKNGTTTVEIDEVEFEIEFEYCDGEEAVIHAPGEMCHPGSSPEMNVLKITSNNGKDWSSHFLDDPDSMEKLKNLVWENIEED